MSHYQQWDEPPSQYPPHFHNESSFSLASNHSYNDNASAYADSVYNLNAGRGPYADYLEEPSNLRPLERQNTEKRLTYLDPKARRRRRAPIFISLVALVILAAAGVALYLFVFKKKSTGTSTSTSGGSGSVQNKINVAVTGGDGSTVTAADGSTFTYTNPYGGTWYWDADDPFNNGARPQSWSPALNETFHFGVDKIRGVNIGGWLVTEPFIVPGLYETVQAAATSNITVIDEYTLLQAGGQSALENHYATFITEQDFMEIAAAGLNFVRIPLGYWAIEVLDGEGFLPRTSWTYFLKAVQWARKYGLRINIDLHALPGSQNGWNHSGRLGTYNVLFGPMGIANAQRALDYVRILAEFVSQPEYRDVIPVFGVTNEPQGGSITQDVLSRYYLQAYDTVRLASGLGAGNGPFVSFHDGFLGPDKWSGFLPNSDRASLDMHPYLCFTTQSADPITAASRQTAPCSSWGALFNNTMADFGFIVAGEWSNAVTDCGLYVNGVGQGVRYDGTFTGGGNWPKLGDCETDWLNWESWDATTKAAYMSFAQGSMDALQNWFFWTWKIGNSTVTNRIEAPHWSYQLGLQHGWMPADPRSAQGTCNNTSPFAGPLQPAQTGDLSAPGAGQISDAVRANLTWPPPVIFFPNSATTAGTLLPTYSPVGTPVTMPGPSFTANGVAGTATASPGGAAQNGGNSSVNVGSGWTNQQDSAGMMKPVPGCYYFDPWVGSSQAPPSPLCTNAPPARRVVRAPEPMWTPPPAVKRR